MKTLGTQCETCGEGPLRWERTAFHSDLGIKQMLLVCACGWLHIVEEGIDPRPAPGNERVEEGDTPGGSRPADPAYRPAADNQRVAPPDSPLSEPGPASEGEPQSPSISVQATSLSDDFEQHVRRIVTRMLKESDARALR